jgi:MOSC domain-containing protein YiiM
VDHAVEVRAAGARGESGLAGDHIADHRDHGGPDQAVYAYAIEDLRAWSHELGRPLDPGAFGENLTTSEFDVTGALIGQRVRVGEGLLLEVTCPRIPCRTFAGELGVDGWVKRFTEAAVPGAYFRVIQPGAAQAGDPITIESTPEHDVTIGLAFRALTLERELLPRLLDTEALPDEHRAKARAAAGG